MHMVLSVVAPSARRKSAPREVLLPPSGATFPQLPKGGLDECTEKYKDVHIDYMYIALYSGAKTCRAMALKKLRGF
jgi:hypothetical protein